MHVQRMGGARTENGRCTYREWAVHVQRMGGARTENGRCTYREWAVHVQRMGGARTETGRWKTDTEAGQVDEGGRQTIGKTEAATGNSLK